MKNDKIPSSLFVPILVLGCLLSANCGQRKDCISVISIAVDENAAGLESTGEISGRIIETDGQASIGRLILLEGPQIQKTMTAGSNINGEFTFRNVPPGENWLVLELDCRTSWGLIEHESRQCRQAVYVNPQERVRVVLRIECEEWSLSVQCKPNQ